MKIELGGIVLVGEHNINRTWIIMFKKSGGIETKICKLDTSELKTAIEAIEKSIWRP